MCRSSFTDRILSGLVLAVMIGLLPSCNRTTSNTSVNDEFDQFGDRAHSMQGEARLLTRDGEADYEKAKAEIANGKYRSGIGNLERLIADRGIDPEIREEALLSVAEAHGSWLNPFRNYEKGMQFCQQFLNDYPDSPKREFVEQLLLQYRTSMADQP